MMMSDIILTVWNVVQFDLSFLFWVLSEREGEERATD